jgi:hypothetical protein
MKVVLSTSVDEAHNFCAPAEMSRALEKIYRRTVERFSANATATCIVPKLPTRVIINGREFESAQEMPPVYRRFYEEMLARALPVEHAIYTVARVEHTNSIVRTISLAAVAFGFAAAVVYLWLHGYYR